LVFWVSLAIPPFYDFEGQRTDFNMTDIKVDETGKIHHLEEFDNLEANTWTVEEEREVRRKLDFHVVPVLTFMYLLCFVRSPYVPPSQG
jgi:hypothetical protein